MNSDKETFSAWVERQYKQWSRGHRSVNEFAKWLGIPQPTLQAWLYSPTRRATSNKNIRILAEKLSPEVYDVLDLQRPKDDPLAQPVKVLHLLLIFDG